MRYRRGGQDRRNRERGGKRIMWLFSVPLQSLAAVIALKVTHHTYIHRQEKKQIQKQSVIASPQPNIVLPARRVIRTSLVVALYLSLNGQSLSWTCASHTLLLIVSLPVREDFLGQASKLCPSVLDYTIMAKDASMPNTPPTWR